MSDLLLSAVPTPFVIAMVFIGILVALVWTFGENALEPDSEIEDLVEPKSKFIGGLDVADRVHTLLREQNREQEQDILTRVSAGVPRSEHRQDLPRRATR